MAKMISKVSKPVIKQGGLSVESNWGKKSLNKATKVKKS